MACHPVALPTRRPGTFCDEISWSGHNAVPLVGADAAAGSLMLAKEAWGINRSGKNRGAWRRGVFEVGVLRVVENIAVAPCSTNLAGISSPATLSVIVRNHRDSYGEITGSQVTRRCHQLCQHDQEFAPAQKTVQRGWTASSKRIRSGRYSTPRGQWRSAGAAPPKNSMDIFGRISGDSPRVNASAHGVGSGAAACGRRGWQAGGKVRDQPVRPVPRG